MSLYIITHKYLDSQIEKKGYNYLYVGAYKQEEKKAKYLYDDSQDNISEKNNNYCELTGLYWIWKNCNDKYKGIVHYRRFFTKKALSKNEKYFYNEEELNQLLKENDILVAERIYVPEKSVYDDYVKYHYKRDIDNLRKTIQKYYPDYIFSFDEVFAKNYYSPCNMVYCKSEIFDEYCEWLFGVLSKLEKITDISNYNVQQARIYGFIAERLLNVWVNYKKIKKKELNIVQLDSSFKFMIRKSIEKILKKSIKGNYKYQK